MRCVFFFLQEENYNLKRDMEELRLKAEAGTESQMDGGAGGDDWETKFKELKKNKDQDHQDLMMEMHTQELDWAGEREELQKEIEKLHAELEGGK